MCVYVCMCVKAIQWTDLTEIIKTKIFKSKKKPTHILYTHILIHMNIHHENTKNKLKKESRIEREKKKSLKMKCEQFIKTGKKRNERKKKNKIIKLMWENHKHTIHHTTGILQYKKATHW